MNKVLTFICIVALLCAVVGCGGQETKSDAQPTQPQVDPRYATAEALLDYFNELNTASPPASRGDSPRVPCGDARAATIT